MKQLSTNIQAPQSATSRQRASAPTNQLRHRLAALLHSNVQVSRANIFGNSEPATRPINLPDDSAVMFAGYIGRGYKIGNSVLLAINPGGGGDAYTRQTREDEIFYPLLHTFKASVPDKVMDAFEAVNNAFEPIVRGWNIWRLLQPVLDAFGCELEEIAYINAVPYRTRKDLKPSVSAIMTAWGKVTGPLVELLEPSRIVALGKKAGSVLDRCYAGQAYKICIPRTIGDTYISDEAKVVLRQIAQGRQP